jgi:ATP phosphoribosyltransferase
MADEKKIKLALPKGALADKNKWNVGNILKLAGIGEYVYGDHGVAGFNSKDPEVEVTVLKPRDIIKSIDNCTYAMGITGKDLVEEELRLQRKFHAFSTAVQEVCDLGCGYVDLAFLMTQERWEETEKWFTEKLNKLGPEQKSELNIEEISRLEIFINFLSEKFKSIIPPPTLMDLNSLPICRTEYPNIAKSVSNSKKKILDLKELPFLIEESRGATEDQLDIAHFILETVATGDSIKKHNLFLLENVLSSTARLYVPAMCLSGEIFERLDCCYPKSYLYGKNIQWTREKVQEIKGRIEDVLKDIEPYCQVSFRCHRGYDLSLIAKQRVQMGFGWSGDDEDVYFDCLRYFPESLKSKIKSLFYRPCGTSFVTYEPYPTTQDIIVNKTDLPEIKRFLEEAGPKLFTYSLAEASAFDLKSLYAYCPVQNESTSLETGWPPGYYGTSPLQKKPKYPCADPTKLRPEHREKALIFSFPEMKST